MTSPSAISETEASVHGTLPAPASRAVQTARLLDPTYKQQAVAAYKAGHLLNASGPSAWLWFLIPVSILLLLAGSALCFSVETVISSTGRVQVRGGALQLRATHSGVVSSLWVQETDTVTKRQALLDVQSSNGEVVTIFASKPGQIEELALHEGDFVQPGQLLLRLLPNDEPLEIVSVVSTADRHKLSSASEVRIELAGHSQTLAARIHHLANDLASPPRLAELFGTGTSPGYLAHLDWVADDTQFRQIAPTLRSGMPVTVRYVLGKRRLIALLVDPLGRWAK